MDRATLHNIFEKAYNHQDWIEVLQSVFGAKQLYAQPKPILLPNNERATEAFELGSFTTSDDRIIGLYRINVKSDVWLERNKVSLRELLRNVYKYDVDGAIVVFVQDEKWRLSFISEIKVLNDEGEIIKQATEPKRYTYLLGKDEKVRTPSDRLSKLTGKVVSLQDMLNAFSVEALNEEFYKIVQSFFYELVGGKIGKGKKVTEYGKGILQLPHTDRSVRQEFAVRLIGRTVFCWFLKMKKSADDIALLPETLLSSNAVKHYNNYYHTILERLFFQTLNTPMEERLRNLPKGTETIPFLNGGLFEPNIEDYYKSDSQGNNQNNFGISDDWFLRFFGELEKYNFTIDENSVTEIEVSVDPEMLGRIFENLLAEIDPDSGETARKATGSFYTPREIVDYMATESLVQYLHNQTGIEQDKLRPVFKMLENEEVKFSEKQEEQILDALDQVKILDPACGSGAFPMGVLQKIVQALQKLDPEAEWWKKRQIDRIKNPTVKKLLKEKLSSSGVEYARKIGVIQNSLYGVDIQPIAAEISKLRCFLSLIVDENINENQPNRGIEPLPNLEFKFVTADTLIKLPEEKQRSMFDNFEELQQLEELRNEYIQSFGKAKARVKEQFLKVQQKIAKDQSSLFADSNSKAYKLGNWNPFSNDKSDWFDPKWMFGIEKFDVVIGNPPYVQIKWVKNNEELKKQDFKSFVKSGDLYCLFYEKSNELLSNIGVGAFITSNKWLRSSYGKGIRNYFIKNSSPLQLIDFGGVKIFKSATVDTNILIWNRTTEQNNKIKGLHINQNNPVSIDLSFIFFQNYGSYKFQEDESWLLVLDHEIKLKNKIEEKFKPFGDRNVKLYYGILTGANPVFLINKEKRDELIKLDIKNSKIIKPIIRGQDLENFGLHFNDMYLINAHNGVKSKNIQPIDVKKDYPTLLGYFNQFGNEFKNRGEQGINWFNLRSCNYIDEFERDKIIYADIVQERGKFYFDTNKYYTNDTAFIITGEKLKWITAILNSNVFSYLYKKFYSGGGLSNKGLRFKKEFLEKVPFPDDKKFVNVFSNITEILQFLKKIEMEIGNHVSNIHIAQLFEEVNDAMVMELYFKEDFAKAGIEFIRYAERDFESIEGKEEPDQIEIIHAAYQKLREKDNEIRNNLKLMDIKLADIVMPIKTAK
jgi:adenine-specific DNA-methyltransferase